MGMAVTCCEGGVGGAEMSGEGVCQCGHTYGCTLIDRLKQGSRCLFGLSKSAHC
jgi:hypothetical protein